MLYFEKKDQKTLSVLYRMADQSALYGAQDLQLRPGQHRAPGSGV